MVLNYIYTDRIDPTKRSEDGSSSRVEDPLSNRIVLLMMDVYRLALQFNMKRLEQLCVQYLKATISHANVLEALHNAAHLKLYFIKEFCLSFIVKEINYNQIVMSKEFETLDQPLMVEIIRKRQMPQRSVFPRQCDPSTGEVFQNFLWDNHFIFFCLNLFTALGTTLEQDMEAFLKSVGREFCDITLMLDGVPIPAHKAILAARCSYFEGMFRSFMPENNTVNVRCRFLHICLFMVIKYNLIKHASLQQIQIGEMIPSSESFDSLLRYIYYADVSMPPEDSLYLFTAPVFYGFTNNRLQAFCKQNLEMNVTFENVIQILEAADRMQAVDMKKYALNLIVHHFTKVYVTILYLFYKIIGLFYYKCHLISLQVARLPRLKQLSRELLLDILEALADERSEARTCQDMANDCWRMSSSHCRPRSWDLPSPSSFQVSVQYSILTTFNIFYLLGYGYMVDECLKNLKHRARM